MTPITSTPIKTSSHDHQPVAAPHRLAASSKAREDWTTAGFACVLGTLVLLFSFFADSASAQKLNLGLYGQHYVRVVGTSEAWLVHPTGHYVDLTIKKNRKKHWYSPDFLETRDMDATAADLSSARRPPSRASGLT